MSAEQRSGRRQGSRVEVRAVILAGGRGTRFWPLGRERRPKQFLPIVGRRSMIEETVARVRPLIPARRVLMVADGGRTRALRRLFRKIPRANFVVEPVARNTAPALMLAMAHVWLENPAAVIVVLPADHLVRENAKYLKKLRAAVALAAEEPCFVTFGVPPAYASTGYGYIQYSRDKAKTPGGEAFYSVRAFREKPDLDLAEQFLAAGDCAWNSGMFVWRAEVFAQKLEAFAPDLWRFWPPLVEALRKKNGRLLRRTFEKVPATSIDYALMEKAQGVYVGEGDFGWSDVGAWSSLFDVWKADKAGNVARGDRLVLDSQGCLIYNPGGLTALVGVRDLIIVQAGGALLVCPSSQDQRVKDVVELLRKMGKLRYL